MKKAILFMAVLSLSTFLFGCMNGNDVGPGDTAAKEAGLTTDVGDVPDEGDETAVSNLVLDFGKRLQLVSLLAPGDVLRESMKENYADLVSPALLEKWQNDPASAPGRLVSSPWPDRIEIKSVEKLSEDTFRVKGEIIEITSEEQSTGGAAAKRPITLEVKKIDGRWLIDAVTLGEYEGAGQIVYQNTQYGFNFTLPESWKDYSIVTGEWEGLSISDSPQKVVETGPIISIRHPEWTSENPRQDIPIMVFTLSQWASLEKEQFHIGAAPIGPSELSRNSKYVFALPARYNFAFPAGYEEVEKILSGNPLKPTEEFNK